MKKNALSYAPVQLFNPKQLFLKNIPASVKGHRHCLRKCSELIAPYEKQSPTLKAQANGVAMKNYHGYLKKTYAHE